MSYFEFQNAQTIELCDESPTGETHMTINSAIDKDGNYKADIEPISIKLDNHQMYLLAMALLKNVETIDTRGSN